MEQIERILAEIHRLKNELEGYSAQEVLDYIESYINIISREQPSSSDLDEAAQKVEDYYDVGDEHGYLYCHRGDIKDAFKAGAKWQYQKDRGEFAKIKAKTWCEGFDAHKEQMLKDAVEADVNTYIDLAAGKSWAEFVVRMPTKDLGDKVHLIIIKEDKQ